MIFRNISSKLSLNKRLSIAMTQVELTSMSSVVWSNGCEGLGLGGSKLYGDSEEFPILTHRVCIHVS